MNDLVELGRTRGASGFKGWVRVEPLESGEVLEAVRDWVLVDAMGVKTPVRVKGLRRHGPGFIAKWDGCESKEEADRIRSKVAVPRSSFPDAGEESVWAVDLCGCRVVNTAGVELGVVAAIGSNGVQDLLLIDYETEEGKSARFMIPCVKDVYILRYDIPGKTIEVDWDPSWR